MGARVAIRVEVLKLCSTQLLPSGHMCSVAPQVALRQSLHDPTLCLAVSHLWFSSTRAQESARARTTHQTKAKLSEAFCLCIFIWPLQPLTTVT